MNYTKNLKQSSATSAVCMLLLVEVLSQTVKYLSLRGYVDVQFCSGLSNGQDCAGTWKYTLLKLQYFA